MTLIDLLCAHKNPVVAYRARRLLAGEPESSRALRTLRLAIGSSEMAKRLLLALNGERFNPYRKWQGPHWTLYSLAEIGFPAGDERLLPLCGYYSLAGLSQGAAKDLRRKPDRRSSQANQN